MNSELDLDLQQEVDAEEIEIMEFTISNNIFGINVTGVKEIMMESKVKPMPHSHPCIEGVFKPRDSLITVVNLPHYLNFDNKKENQRSLFIITAFENMNVAFRVDAVIGINHISLQDIEKPDKTIYGGDNGIATGIAKCEDRLITILDFEKIISNLSLESKIQTSNISGFGARKKNNVPIVVVQSSVTLSQMVLQCLQLAGFTNIKEFEDGKKAWDFLSSLEDEIDVVNAVECLITDIEMPELDGHKLIEMMKNDKRFEKIPVIVFSTLLTKEMEIKGDELGVHAQLSKPDINELISVLDELFGESNEDD